MKGFWAVYTLCYTEQRELDNFWTLRATYKQGTEDEQIGGAISFKKSLDK